MRYETLLKIMKLFRRDIHRGYSILQVSKELGIGYRPAYNHIYSLNKENIIDLTTMGKAKICSLNLKNPKCRKLLEQVDILRKEKLYEKTRKIGNILNDLISAITSKSEEILSIILFGSHAKNIASKSSDIDLFFIVQKLNNKKVRETIERECSQYAYSHNLRITPVISDKIEFKKMLHEEKNNIGKEIKIHGLPLYGIEQFWRLIT